MMVILLAIIQLKGTIMKKYVIYSYIVIAVVIFGLFKLWRSECYKTDQLEAQNSALTLELNSVKEILSKKETIISDQNNKYNVLLDSIKYTECESLPVSETLLKAAKELQE